MGEDLSLHGRDAIRTPMQWGDRPNGGFSRAPADRLIRPVIADGDYGYPRVNVTAQRRDAGSLLAWFERMVRTLRECPEAGAGHCAPLDADVPAAVLAHRSESPEGAMLFLHNLGRDDVTLDLGAQPGEADQPVEVFADQQYDAPSHDLRRLPLAGYGYRWIRLWRNV